MSHDPFALDDAAYVLGALSPSDRQAYEEHLRSCERCAATVAELAGLPGLLARADQDVLDESAGRAPLPPELPPDLLTDLLHDVRRDRRKRRAGALTAAAAVLAVVAATSSMLTWGVIRQLDAPEATQAEPTQATLPLRQMTQVAQGGLSASVAVEPVPWGTRLTVVCRYPATAPAGGYGEEGPARYQLVVLTDAGLEEAVASWVALPGRAMTVTGATSWNSNEILDIEVRGPDGRPVLRLPG